ncbi:hypothetical protein QOZ80_5AG0388290 [Eleusine coracana subsp. coracana]|nr:hypothetical protein QOZ80_5AG0388290 [Eleusine coracana subsp. coracana]
MARTSSSSDKSGQETEGTAEFESLFGLDDLQKYVGSDYIISRGSKLSEKQKEKVTELIKEIRSDFPLFVAIMRASNVTPHQPSLVVPIRYGDAHFPRKSQTVTLQRPGKNKKWHAKFDIRKDGSSHKYILSSSWSQFVRDNHVCQGDICIFQPMNDTNEKFMATVYLLRESKSYSFSGRTRKKTTNANRVSYFEAGPRAKVTSTTHAMAEPVDGEMLHVWDVALAKQLIRGISISVGASSLHTIVFDKPYASKYLPDGEQTLILMRTRNKKKWEVKINPRTDGVQILTLGWNTFVDDNLAIEDICLFQLMNNERSLIMAVDIIHHRANPPFLYCYGCGVEQEPDLFDDSEGPSQPPLYVVLSGAVGVSLRTPISQHIMSYFMDENHLHDFDTLYAAPYLPDGEQTLTLHRTGWCKSWSALMHNRRIFDGEL